MTNTKFRKRALLSSVAMLLVALVALGSATFAWFTENPNASASGLPLKATAAKGLVILTSSSQAKGATTYVHTDYLNASDALRTGSSSTPIELNAMSLDTTTTTAFSSYTTSAASETSPAGDPAAAVTSATASVYNEKIYCKLLGSADTATLKFQSSNGLVITGISGQEISSAVRVALYYYDSSATTKTFIGEYAIAAAANEKHLTGTIAADTDDTSGNDLGYNDVDSTTYSVLAASAANGTTIGTVDASGDDYVDVYVYLDGEDANCQTSKVSANNIVSGVSIAMTVTD